MKSIFICLLGILFACPALAGKKAVENHYRAIHQNVPISISVSDDINRDSRVFKSLTARGFPWAHSGQHTEVTTTCTNRIGVISPVNERQAVLRS